MQPSQNPIPNNPNQAPAPVAPVNPDLPSAPEAPRAPIASELPPQPVAPPPAAPLPQAPVAPAPQVPVQPDPIVYPDPVAPAAPVVGPNPTEAADIDVIEKEWVDQADKIVSQTSEDPYVEEEAVESLQQDYLQKRYGHNVVKPDQN